jgi:hypothetical protein
VTLLLVLLLLLLAAGGDGASILQHAINSRWRELVMFLHIPATSLPHGGFALGFGGLMALPDHTALVGYTALRFHLLSDTLTTGDTAP